MHSRDKDLYRAVWRWHFYAGLVVLPFLVWLAITGGLYLFKAEIDGWWHRDLKVVVPAASAPRPASEWVAAALAAQPGTLRKLTPAASATGSAELGIRRADGERVTVYVDPYRAQVLGTLPEGGTLAWTIRKLHSLKYFGPVARGFIEMAAGWSLLLVLTGLYLWWPRGGREGRGGVLTVRGQPRQRVFWRDLHAVTGLCVGAVLAFLAITGMPWSVLWGQQVNQWANGHNFGYPAGVRVQLPMSQQRLPETGSTAWSLAQARVPQSQVPSSSVADDHAGHAGHAGHQGHEAPAAPRAATLPGMLNVDEVMARVQRLGLAPGFIVSLPAGPTGVFTAAVYPRDVAQQRVVHLDAYSGAVLLDMGYADYGPLGRWLEWGINVHLGQEYGVPNQAVLVLACLAIVLLCVSAAVMWWKRRPIRALGVPPAPADPRVMRGLLALLVVGGLLFPLVGASLLVMAALDRLLAPRLLPPAEPR